MEISLSKPTPLEVEDLYAGIRSRHHGAKGRSMGQSIGTLPKDRQGMKINLKRPTPLGVEDL